mmetsp:Transcript_2068/g.4473  ORF Transcript_2068/g.4473 Transcript_2068/m.4473 type:complete len:278 (+) Transcript_2068:167-1000(+)
MASIPLASSRRRSYLVRIVGVSYGRHGRSVRNAILFFWHFLFVSLTGEIGDLEPEAECRETLHQNLALVRGDGGDVHRPFRKYQREGFVRVRRLAFLSQYRCSRVHRAQRIGAPGVSHLVTGRQVELGGSLGAVRLARCRFPAQRAAVGMYVQDAQPRFAPSRSPVFYDRDARPQPRNETTNDKVRCIRASRGRLEGGQIHGHPNLVCLGCRRQGLSGRHGIEVSESEVLTAVRVSLVVVVVDVVALTIIAQGAFGINVVSGVQNIFQVAFFYVIGR